MALVGEAVTTGEIFMQPTINLETIVVSGSQRDAGSPDVSLVMPCYQQVAFLEEAVRSVLDQRECVVELLVMDPGSTDGSRELLKRLRKEYGTQLRLQFFPDAGQSDAVNKGMALARGNVLGWLNSDDRLRPGTLDAVTLLLNRPEPAWLYGRSGVIDGSSRPISPLVVRYKNWRGRSFSLQKLLTENFIPQMAVFWNRAIWEWAGGLDLSRDLDMDYDLWLRFAEVANPLVLDRELADYRVHRDAKGSRLTGAQLDAAYRTACHHAASLGVKGQWALILHKLFGWRTRIAYRWLKP